MKSMKIRLLKKLKSLPAIISLKQTAFSQLNTLEILSQKSDSHPPTATPGGFSPSKQILKDSDDEYYDASLCIDDKESHTPLLNSPYPVQDKDDSSSEDDISSLQARERLDEVSLNCPCLSNYETKCPPGGEDCVILYTTSLRGIRKTSEDCKAVQFLLKSFKLVFYNRDVSMHSEYRDELWNVLGGRVVPPRLFIKGRYIGGADEVVTLHEQGNLRKLLHGIPVDPSSNEPCRDCGGVGFVVCLYCKGSHKVFTDNYDEGVDGLFVKCTHCNENGLVKCSNCY